MKQVSRIPEMLAKAVEDGAIAGAVTIVWREGSITQVNAVGERDCEQHLPMQRDTIFRMASMTKPVTSVAALMLLDEGRLTLDDPITRWAPEFAETRVLSRPDAPLNEIERPARAITIRDLLTHRAGLIYEFLANTPLAEAQKALLGAPIDSALSPDQWVAALASLPLAHQPGQVFSYGRATDLLGFLIERISGVSLAEFLRERIFEPLGMVDTRFELGRDQHARLSNIYRHGAAGTLERSPFALRPAGLSYASGGQGLYSTVDDYLQFARMLLGKGELDNARMMKPETVELMCTNHLTDAQRAASIIGVPMFAGHGMGLGVSIVVDETRPSPFLGFGRNGAIGWPGAFGTWWQVDPAADQILIYLVQHTFAVGSMARNGPPRHALPMATFQTLALARD